MKRDLQLAGDFLAEHQPAHGRRDDGATPRERTLAGERSAELLDGGHLLQGDGALEELPAVQPAAQDEMAFEQRAGVAENLQNFVFGHGEDDKFKEEREKGKVREWVFKG